MTDIVLEDVAKQLKTIPGHSPQEIDDHEYYGRLVCTCGYRTHIRVTTKGKVYTYAQRAWEGHLSRYEEPNDTVIDVARITRTKGVQTLSVMHVKHPRIQEYAQHIWWGSHYLNRQEPPLWLNWLVVSDTVYKNGKHYKTIEYSSGTKRECINWIVNRKADKADMENWEFETLIEVDEKTGSPALQQASLTGSVSAMVTKADTLLNRKFAFRDILEAKNQIEEIDRVTSGLKLLSLKREQLQGRIDGAVQKAVGRETS